MTLSSYANVILMAQSSRLIIGYAKAHEIPGILCNEQETLQQRDKPGLLTTQQALASNRASATDLPSGSVLIPSE